MVFIIWLIMGVLVFIIAACSIIFYTISRQLDELCETIREIEDMIYDKDHEDFYNNDFCSFINPEEDNDKDLEEGDN